MHVVKIAITHAIAEENNVSDAGPETFLLADERFGLTWR
jgi:hypothetical protein